jgi:hypothetical protein
LPDSFSLKAALEQLHWKSIRNVTDRDYDSLRPVLEQLGLPVPGNTSTLGMLKKILGCESRRIHCCEKLHIAYTGQYGHARKCPACNKPRNQDVCTSHDAEDAHTILVDDSDSDNESADLKRVPLQNSSKVMWLIPVV